MTTFYCDRLEDEISVKDNIAGLRALHEMSGFGEEEVTKVCSGYMSFPEFCLTRDYLMMWICRSIYKLLDCRYTCWWTVWWRNRGKVCISNDWIDDDAVLKKLGKSFIEGFITLMTNEKDPHNLMLVFSILKVILVEFDIVGLQEVRLSLKNLTLETLRCGILLLPHYFQSPTRWHLWYNVGRSKTPSPRMYLGNPLLCPWLNPPTPR